MEPQAVSTSEVLTGDRFRRMGQQPEQFVEALEQPLETLIVMGASAGGYPALERAVKGLSQDLPAAVVILLHSGSRRVADYQLEHALSRSTELPV